MDHQERFRIGRFEMIGRVAAVQANVAVSNLVEALPSITFEDVSRVGEIVAEPLVRFHGVTQQSHEKRTQDFFFHMRSAAEASVRDSRTLDAVLGAIDEVDRTCVAKIEGNHPALRMLGLRADDLALVAHMGEILLAEAKSTLDFKRPQGDGVMDKVRARLMQGRASAVERKIAEYDLSGESSPEAIAKMVVAAAKERSRDLHSTSDKGENPDNQELLAAAVAMMPSLSEEDAAWVANEFTPTPKEMMGRPMATCA